jgi:hypothetical protein
MNSEKTTSGSQSIATKMKISGLRIAAAFSIGACLTAAQGAPFDYSEARARQQAGYDCTLSQSRGTLSCYEQKNMAAPVCAPGFNRTADRAYSGSGAGRNNPAMQGVENIGPIPRGSWSVSGVQQDLHGKAHSNVLRLQADPGTNTFNRHDILVHGDNATGTASKGCVIAPAQTRSVLQDAYTRGGQVRINVVR